MIFTPTATTTTVSTTTTAVLSLLFHSFFTIGRVKIMMIVTLKHASDYIAVYSDKGRDHFNQQ